jgi:hypothetical protein
MTKIDLHELVNLPYGEANKRLEAAGHFKDSDMKEYTVEVRGFYRPEEDQHVVTVTAPNEDVAFEKACDQTDFDAITCTTILSVTDIKEDDL